LNNSQGNSVFSPCSQCLRG